MSLNELYGIKHPTAWVEFEKGDISEDVLVSKFFRDGRTFDSEGMKRMMMEACDYLDGMQHLLRELSEKSIEMHAMSNYPVWYQDINNKLQIDRYLQGWTFMSCEGPMKGLRKPDPKCWEVAQEYLGAEASQLVLIDDRQENCESARKAGLHAIHSRDANSTRSQLVELSVLKEV
ncbi:g7647 [Coccomyxa viridis]|uniref:G7647 protein n=1 Tax=Coccomyxa viridis TaxID=1274662 RepID=A0ABP1FYD4_9CHLO